MQKALSSLSRLEHRGAVAGDGRTGDGAGITLQVPRALLRSWLRDAEGTDSGKDPRIGLGMFFLPRGGASQQKAEKLIEAEIAREGFRLIMWRDVPCELEELGASSLLKLPAIRQAFVIPEDDARTDLDEIERGLYLVRRRVQRVLSKTFGGAARAYACSLSLRTVVYKALCRASTLGRFYKDLTNPRFESAAAVFHRRFSTNTAPTWALVQPLRQCAHNGEFNTLQGNVSWLRARERSLFSPLFGEHTKDLVPLADFDDSDSVTFDRVFELLVMAGRDPEVVMSLLCPEPYTHMPDMDPAVRAMCRYHSELIEPWDGPAGVVFFDGRTVGAGLDRNGLRPMRYAVTRDGLVVGGSEAGLVDLDASDVVELGRLGPGHVIAVDLVRNEIRRNDDIKVRAASRHPFLHWVEQGVRDLSPGDDDRVWLGSTTPDLLKRQLAFGYSREDIERILQPMAEEAKSPVGSMGDDTPPTALSENPQLLYRCFKQRFAQVTNPPLDSLRERLNMSLETSLGRYSNILDDGPEVVKLVRLDSPIISDVELERLCNPAKGGERGVTVPAVFDPADTERGLERGVTRICNAAVEAVRAGARVLVLSDRCVDAGRAPVPMLLAVSAVHGTLVDLGLRLECSIIADTGEAREDHHIACLVGFGATLVLPYLAIETVRGLAPEGRADEAIAGYREALESGLLKIMSKMGVTVIQSYRGARLFEILGLCESVSARYFSMTATHDGNVGLQRIGADQLAFHRAAFGEEPLKLVENGSYRYRKGGERHANSPDAFKLLHKAVRTGDQAVFDSYTKVIDEREPIHVRDLLTWVPAGDEAPLDEVEGVSRIAARLYSQAMSHGAISREVHEVIAIAMNTVGGRSNSGEGGEAPQRFVPYTVNGNPAPTFHSKWSPKAGDYGLSRVKQIAAGRFGVTPEYLASASELEIKISQGAKPGEGGQIPGFKVTAEIGAQRNAMPGTPLISPPPHHDIYSIEDLAQLIHDLKCVNPRATVCVKLVASKNIGTIACGVAKAGADCIGISGADGGTGAAPLSSLKHAGIPWEFGLAEAHQALVANGLRNRVRLRVDGGFQTGRDVVIAALMGADEMGFGTAVLIAAGCVMARRCHDNSCPVGVATQDEKLRAKFPGTPEHVIALFSFIAEEVRMHLAALGVRTVAEIIGRVDLLREAEGASGVLPFDVAPLLIEAGDKPGLARGCDSARNGTRPLSSGLDDAVFRTATKSMMSGEAVEATFKIHNTDLSVGARLGGEIGRRRIAGQHAMAPIHLTFRGVAGQSFGAFCTSPLELTLVGEAQDGVGKSMNGGRIIVRAPAHSGYDPHDATLCGNAILYGATGGEAYIAGRAGERFAVRNSGAIAVVEGCGDHGCEYMTGGRVVVLGRIGRNFAAGMTGGIAWVYDEAGYLTRHHTAEGVVIERLTSEDETNALRQLVMSHARHTASSFAARLLADWSNTVLRMCVVKPRPLVKSPEEAPLIEAEPILKVATKGRAIHAPKG